MTRFVVKVLVVCVMYLSLVLFPVLPSIILIGMLSGVGSAVVIGRGVDWLCDRCGWLK